MLLQCNVTALLMTFGISTEDKMEGKIKFENTQRSK